MNYGIDLLDTYQSFANKRNFQIFSFFDAFTLICPLTIHNLERVSINFLCLHFMLTGWHAGHLIKKGATYAIDILA